MAITLDQQHKESVVNREEAKRPGYREYAKQNELKPGLPFSFTGNAKEYFGIWIVNIFLSIITLGIYSAWAKVRNKRYFYGNTLLEGSSFAYLASPVQILKGRLIVVAVLGTIALLTAINPGALLLYAPLYLVLPFAIQRALRFNAIHSSYRNVRFNFTGDVGEAYWVYLFLPFLGIFTFGLIAPYINFSSQRYVVSNSKYGQAIFVFEGRALYYYITYGLAFLLGTISYIAVVSIFAFFAISLGGKGTGLPPSQDPAFWLSVSITGIIGVILALFIYSLVTVRIQNHVFNNTRIGNHQLFLDLRIWPFLWIRFSNLFLIAISFGLVIPWAKIRMARYQIERMSLIPDGDLETAVAEEQHRVGALGDEFGEGMDLDLGLGV